MRLAELVAALPPEQSPVSVTGSVEVPIRGLAIDSRAVAPGDLFVALRGAQADGHAHLGEALALGAAAVVVESLPPELALGDHPAVVVRD